MSSGPRARPCDSCRHRKTRCVKPPDKDQCILCAFHGKKCTYLRGPPSRPRRQSGAASSHTHTQPSAIDRLTPAGTGLGDGDMIAELPHSEDHDMSPASSGGPDRPSDGMSPEDFMSTAPALSLLDGTLGLDLDTHPEFIGPSSFLEPALLDVQRPRDTSTTSSHATASHRPPPAAGGQARRVDQRSMFLVYSDEATASESQRVADCDAIEDCVRPLGKALVNLYFRIVHPSYPILHKGVYLAKHAVSHRMFSPPLLAAVYLVALEYQLYDSTTTGSVSSQPAKANGQAMLEEIAERTMAEDLRRPKLSTLQAGLLLLQRGRIGTGPSGWILTAQMVALAQGLGLHVDCQDWAIPEWEKGLRRRLGWALYMQDRWGALAWGRPALLSDDSWDLQPCTPADFEPTSGETADAGSEVEADGSVPIDTGREAFTRQTELARLLSQVMAHFYTTAATKPGGALDAMGPAAAAQLAKPLVLHLREWHAALPPDLSLEHIVFRRLSCAAPLHLAHAAVEVALHRALLRAVGEGEGAPGELARAVRSAARSRVQSAVALLSALRPEHTGGFWPAAAAHQVAAVGSLAALLWATTDDDEELRWCAERVDELRWALRVRGQGASFMGEALRLLDTVGEPVGLGRR